MVFIRFLFGREVHCIFQDSLQNSSEILDYVASYLESEDFGVYYNGKKLGENEEIYKDETVHVSFSLPGGKGGFGSMLRAIGAQIEKTTNREACRDLSGRRLRDINEEQRLKKWIAKESEREQEKARRRKERIERLKAKPRHNFVDFDFEKSISELPERIDDALTAGMQKVTKRPAEEEQISQPSTSKKKCLWLGDDLSDSSDSEPEAKVGTSSQKDLASHSLELDTNSSESSSTCERIETSNPDNDQLAVTQETHTSESTASGSEERTTPMEESSNEETSAVNNAEELSDENKSSNIIEDISEKSKSEQNRLSQTKSVQSGDDLDCKGESQPEISQNTQIMDSNEKLKHHVNKATHNQEDEKPVDLNTFQSQDELEALGLNRLKFALMARGLKCGGSISDRAQRLWKVRGLKPRQYPTNLLAKNKK